MSHTAPPGIRRSALMALAAAGALAAAALAGCTSTPAPTPGTGSPPASSSDGPASPAPGTVVMIIRHGEKPEGKKSLPGIDETGRLDDSSMTQVGWQRAHKLVDLFAPATGQTRPGLARPAAIYAAGATDDGEGQRTRETVKPLAKRLGVKVNTSYGKGEEQELIEAVSKERGPTLISWQHSEIPDIADSLGAVTPDPPKEWPDKRYDLIWTFTATSNGWTFTQIPELVLPGDSPTPISD